MRLGINYHGTQNYSPKIYQINKLANAGNPITSILFDNLDGPYSYYIRKKR